MTVSAVVVGLGVGLGLATLALGAALGTALYFRRRAQSLLIRATDDADVGPIALTRSPTRSDAGSFVHVQATRHFVLPALQLGSVVGLLETHDTSGETVRPRSLDGPPNAQAPSFELSSATIRAPSRSMMAVDSAETSASPTASEPATPTRSRHRTESGRTGPSRTSTSSRPSVGSRRAGLEVRRPASSQTFGASD